MLAWLRSIGEAVGSNAIVKVFGHLIVPQRFADGEGDPLGRATVDCSVA